MRTVPSTWSRVRTVGAILLARDIRVLAMRLGAEHRRGTLGLPRGAGWKTTMRALRPPLGAVREVFEEPPQANLVAADVARPECARVSRVEITAEHSFPDHRSIDPHFGLPLLMTAKCRHGVLWAYSKRHLRARGPTQHPSCGGSRAAGSSGMFYRLPRLMKLARNREGALEALLRIEQIRLSESDSVSPDDQCVQP